MSSSWLELFDLRSFVASVLSNISSIVNVPSFILFIRGINTVGSYSLIIEIKLNYFLPCCHSAIKHSKEIKNLLASGDTKLRGKDRREELLSSCLDITATGIISKSSGAYQIRQRFCP